MKYTAQQISDIVDDMLKAFPLSLKKHSIQIDKIINILNDEDETNPANEICEVLGWPKRGYRNDIKEIINKHTINTV